MGDAMTVHSHTRAVRVTMYAATGILSLIASCAAFAADITLKEPAAVSYAEPSAPDWTGFYFGGHAGYAWGESNWTARTTTIPSETFATGSLSLAQPINTFFESGSFFEGFQGGYNYRLPNNFVIGAEADASFPSFPNIEDVSIGGISTLASPSCPETYHETVLMSGTLRGRLGYAAGNWLLYATGGFAWTYDELAVEPLAGEGEKKKLWRFGWAAGAGVETPFLPHWTARLEYLYTGYGANSVTFPLNAQRFESDFSQQALRLALNYQIGDGAASSEKDPKPTAKAEPSNIDFHGQSTFTWQGYPPIRSPYRGEYSLPGGGEARQVWDFTLFAGVRLWKGAEFWINPDIDQGFGVGNTRGVAGYPNGESLQAWLRDPLRQG